MCIVAVFLVAGVVLAGCDTSRTETQSAETTVTFTKDIEPTEADPAVAVPTESLPIEQLAGELIMTKLDATSATAQELAAVRSLQLGGIILFGWNVADEAQLRTLTTSLDAARGPAAKRAGLEPNMLVSVDQEGGAIRNVPFAPPEQTQPQLAAEGDDATRIATEATGRGLRAAGVNIDLGPVADLAMGPNRTMAGRAFGSDPAQVASFVEASVRGLQAGGVAATAKHFPGFGASTANSDEAVAYVDRSRAQLQAGELAPFRAAVEAGSAIVMVSHGIHRELGSKLPGTLDPKIATKLLRDEVGFTGVAMTDSMNARGLREAWGGTVPKACPVAIAAGIDILLLTGTLETARLCRARILDAVADGSLPEARVREAACRVGALRRAVAAKVVPAPPEADTCRTAGSAASAAAPDPDPEAPAVGE